MQPRFYCPLALEVGQVLDLPPGAARHVQVLRLQPGNTITLFRGDADQEVVATIIAMGRQHVSVQVLSVHSTQREAVLPVHLVAAIPANDRMDWLVEKATEWGVAAIYPTLTERTVVRLSAERADKKVAHWQSVAVAACEQCGGNRVPVVHPVSTYPQRLAQMTQVVRSLLLLSLQPGSQPLGQWGHQHTTILPSTGVAVFSGPEGGFSPAEEQLGMEQGCHAVSLGHRILRAETAALSALAVLLHAYS